MRGELPALEYYEKCLTIYLKTLRADHPSEVKSYHNIAVVHHAQRDYVVKALEFQEKAFDIESKVVLALSILISKLPRNSFFKSKK